MSEVRRTITRAVAAGALLLVVGCGSSGDSTSNATTATVSSAAGSTGSSAASGASHGSTASVTLDVSLPTDACALFSLAEAQAMLGFPMRSIPPSDGPYDRTCTYVSDDLDGSKPFIEFQVRQLAGRGSSVAQSRDTPGATSVAGLGQDAVNSEYGLNVALNDEYEVIFTVGHLQDNDQDKAVELAKVVIQRLTA